MMKASDQVKLDKDLQYYRARLIDDFLIRRYVLITGNEPCIPVGNHRQAGFSHHYLTHKLAVVSLKILQRVHEEHGGFPNLRIHTWTEIKKDGKLIRAQSWTVEWGAPIPDPYEFDGSVHELEAHVGKLLGYREDCIKQYLDRIGQMRTGNGRQYPTANYEDHYSVSRISEMNILVGNKWVRYNKDPLA